MKRAMVLGAVFSFFVSQAFTQSVNPLPDVPVVTVQGTGQISARPDRASIRLGAEVQADTAAKAQSEVNALVKKALAAIKDAGVSEKNIRTTGLNLYPVYSQQRRSTGNDEPRVTGYRASNILQVQVDDLDLVGKVIDAAMEAGINRLEGLNFEIRNDLPFRREALSAATQEAKNKASAIAQSLGMSLGKVRTIHESGGVTPFAPQFGRMASMAMAESTPVQPGELQVEGTVTITFELEGPR